MKNTQPQRSEQRFTPHAPLAAVGLKINSMKMLDPIKQKVVIPQKSIRHTPTQKLQDAFIAILAGAHGLSEINTRVRSDEALQRAFGRSSCADQSVVQETLNACSELNVQQMQQALSVIFRQQSLAYRHKYGERLQVLDVDTGGNAMRSKPGGFTQRLLRREQYPLRAPTWSRDRHTL